MDDDNGGWTRILRVASRILFLPSPKGQIRSATADSDFPPPSDDGTERRRKVIFLSFFAFADSRNSVGAEEEEEAAGDSTVRVRYA